MLRNHAPGADLPYRLLLKPWIHAALLPSGLLWNYRYPSDNFDLLISRRRNEILLLAPRHQYHIEQS
jgi:hypothetical protein